jgi:hypothetical protein
MTHLTDALSGIVRHFYVDPVDFLDNPIVCDSSAGPPSLRGEHDIPFPSAVDIL